MGWLSGKPKHASGETKGQDRVRKHGQPPAPRRAQTCPCGKGKPVGHAGPCRIPTGTMRNGRGVVKHKSQVTSRGGIRPMGRGHKWL